MLSNPDQNATGPRERYTATYSFNGHRRQPPDEAISQIRETVTGLQDKGIDIEFLGATGEIDTAGKIIEVTARYQAPNKGAIGWLNWRAGLPASGSPQRTDTAENTIDQKPSPRLSGGVAEDSTDSTETPRVGPMRTPDWMITGQ